MQITQPALQAAFPSFVLYNFNTTSSGVYVRFYFCRERGGRGKQGVLRNTYKPMLVSQSIGTALLLISKGVYVLR